MNIDDRVNILLVDDQPAKLLSHEVILRELDENLIKAGSAREALEHLLKTDIAVILIDVIMPDLDGFELAAMIRSHPRFQTTAIIFVSALALTDLDRLKGYESGAVDYVPVPVVPEVLRAKVRVFAELYRKTRQLEALNAELERRVEERTTELAIANAELERRVEERTREREAALAQVHEMQKLESIGQLTGGVAHDFNNLLGVILGGSERLLRRLPEEAADLRRLTTVVMEAADRGATLTHQLLAFSRRQPLEPKPVDLNKLVTNMSEMLRRTLGESTGIKTILAGGLWQVSADANQLENVLLNLAVNARDAMPDGGKLTIETANTELDGAYAAANMDVTAGPYTMLAVTDTGTGMTKEVLQKAFEPFFTTKDFGKGTGLGLSQVYGFVKQSGGHVKIYSEPGQGTTVRLYLPRLVTGETLTEASTEVREIPAGTQEHLILVVEDDDGMRDHSVDTLREIGYRVLQASDGVEALGLLDVEPDIRLLFTDVGLPGGMNGRQLAEEARRRRPDLKVLFTSGYARDVIVHQGRLDPGVELIGKPFTYAGLALKIRRILEAPGDTARTG